MLSRVIALAVGCSAFAFGCASEPQGNSPEDIQEITDNLVQAGYPTSEIMVVDSEVYVGRDALVTLEASREMLVADVGSQEQFRTTNLVGANIDTICVDGGRFRGDFSAALDRSLAAYNALGLSFTMRRTRGNEAGCDALITGRISGPVGGVSGFPAGGLPFPEFQVGKGTLQFGINTTAHVIIHELGHTVGFRHSDFFNRSISCGQGGDEGQAGVGAILIPGTPDTAVLGGSVMNSCFRAVEAGAFTATDITALQTLY
jgi:hypothetical protein